MCVFFFPNGKPGENESCFANSASVSPSVKRREAAYFARKVENLIR